MSSRFVKLDFELSEYADQKDDEDESLLKRCQFRSWADVTHIDFSCGVPTEREIRILTKLTQLLAELKETIA